MRPRVDEFRQLVLPVVRGVPGPCSGTIVNGLGWNDGTRGCGRETDVLAPAMGFLELGLTPAFAAELTLVYALDDLPSEVVLREIEDERTRAEVGRGDDGAEEGLHLVELVLEGIDVTFGRATERVSADGRR